MKPEALLSAQVVEIHFSQAPPSTNNLFAGSGTRRFKSKRYTAWSKLAAQEIMIQRLPRLPGCVVLDIYVRRARSNCDISNYIKAAEDAIVAAGLIDDDKFVDRVTVQWADIPGCIVRIERSEILA